MKTLTYLLVSLLMAAPAWAQDIDGKQQAPRQVMFSFGPAFFDNLNSPQSGLAFTAGYYWAVHQQFDLAVQSDFSVSSEHSDANMLTVKVLSNYFIIDGDISPYVGLGFGYGFASAHDGQGIISNDRANGFALSGQLGVKLFRNSSVNLGVGLDYTMIIDETVHGTPSRFGFLVGVYF